MASDTVTLSRSSTAAPPDTVGGVCWYLIRRPGWLVRQWNWKSALLSSAVRGGLFFVVNLRAGLDAASAALLTEFVLRGVTAGFYGATTQAFRQVRPAWAATAAVSVLLPAMTHSVEVIAHYLRGTPELAASILASAAFTGVSTQFNLFAMRREALIVGAGADSLVGDLRRVPRLILDFVASTIRAGIGGAHRLLAGGLARQAGEPRSATRASG